MFSCLVAGKHGPLDLHECRPYGSIIRPVGEVLLLNHDEESRLEPMLVPNGNMRQVGFGSPDFRPPVGAQERPIKGMELLEESSIVGGKRGPHFHSA